MKNKKIKILLLSLCFLFTILFGAGYYYASTKINSKEIKKVAETVLQNIFPNSKVDIGNLKVSFGLSIGLNLSDLKIEHPHKRKVYPLIKLEKLNVKLPIWAIITGGGNILVDIQKPEIYYKELGKKSNWLHAMNATGQRPKLKNKKQKVKVAKKESSSSKSDFVIPAFLANSSIDLNLSNLTFAYDLADKRKGSVSISRFLIKNVGTNSSAAFEIKSMVTHKLPSGNLSFDTLIIGEVDLPHFLSTKELKSLVAIKLNNIAIANSDFKIPDLKINLDAFVASDGKIGLDTRINYLDKNELNFFLSIADSTVSLKKVLGSFLISDFFKILGISKDNIQFNKSLLTLNGSLKINKSGKMHPDFSLKTSPKIALLVNEIKIKADSLITLKGQKLSATVHGDLLEGTIFTKFSNKLNINRLPTDISNIRPYFLEIALSGVKISSAQLAMINKKTKTETTKVKHSVDQSGKQSVKQKRQDVAAIKFPRGNIEVSLKRIMIDKYKFEGGGAILTTLNSVEIPKFKFNYGTGNGLFTNKVNFFKNGQSGKLSFRFNNFKMDALSPFMPKGLGEIQGIFNGKMGGKFSFLNNKLKHDIFLKINAKDGSLKKVDISQYLTSMTSAISKIPSMKNKIKNKKVKINGDFKTFILKANFKDTHYKISNMKFMGIKDKVEITGKGNIYPISLKKKSIFVGTLKDNSGVIDKSLNKYLGTNVIPYKLAGKQLKLALDYNYTIKKLGKLALKKQGKKAVKKVLKKNVDKFLKSDKNKEKMKKLLKGLFN